VNAAPHRSEVSDVAREPTASPSPDVAARDREQRERIAALEAELARVQTGPTAMSDPQPTKRPFEMSPAELGALAASCRFPFDVPPTAGSTMMDNILAAGIRATKLTDAEQTALRRLIDELQPAYQGKLTALYKELTGSDAELDPMTLVLEIQQKSPEHDLALAYQRLSSERTGHPVAAAATGSVVERYLRLVSNASHLFERRLADEIGADRARAFRRTWGMVDFRPGCP